MRQLTELLNRTCTSHNWNALLVCCFRPSTANPPPSPFFFVWSRAFWVPRDCRLLVTCTYTCQTFNADRAVWGISTESRAMALVTVRMLLWVTHVASLERLLKSYLEGFPRFNLKRKEKERLEGGGVLCSPVCKLHGCLQETRLHERDGRGRPAGTDNRQPVHKTIYCCKNFRRRNIYCANVTNRWIGEYSHRASIRYPYLFSKSAARWIGHYMVIW